MSEWFKVQPWKGCVREIAPRVRIPLSAPNKKILKFIKERNLLAKIRTGGKVKATMFAFARPGVIVKILHSFFADLKFISYIYLECIFKNCI